MAKTRHVVYSFRNLFQTFLETSNNLTNLRHMSFQETSLNALSKFSQTELLCASHSLHLLDYCKHCWIFSIDALHCLWDNDCPEVCHQFLKINSNQNSGHLCLEFFIVIKLVWMVEKMHQKVCDSKRKRTNAAEVSVSISMEV